MGAFYFQGISRSFMNAAIGRFMNDPDMRARPNLHELLNFRCTRCSDRDARLGYFLLHINKSEWSERGPTPPRPGVEPIERNPDNNPKTTSRGRRMPVIPRARSLSRAPLSPQEPRCFSSFFRARPPPLRATLAKLPRNNRSAAPPCRKTNGYAFAPQSPHAFLTLNLPRFLLSNFAVCGIFSQ